MNRKIFRVVLSLLLLFVAGMGGYCYYQHQRIHSLYAQADSAYRQHEYRKAIECLENIIKQYPDEQHFLKNCAENIGCLQLLAQCYLDLKEYDRADKYFNLTLKTTVEKYGRTHFSVATAYYGLGKLSLDQNLPDAALDSFRQGLQILEISPPRDGFYAARILWGIALACEQKKDYREAILYARKSLAATAHAPIPEQQQKINSAIKNWERLLPVP